MGRLNGARLVAKGYNQLEGIDFAFSPEPTTIRLVLALAVMNKWSVRQQDVQNLFCPRKIKERVFMAPYVYRGQH